MARYDAFDPHPDYPGALLFRDTSTGETLPAPLDVPAVQMHAARINVANGEHPLAGMHPDYPHGLNARERGYLAGVRDEKGARMLAGPGAPPGAYERAPGPPEPPDAPLPTPLATPQAPPPDMSVAPREPNASETGISPGYPVTTEHDAYTPRGPIASEANMSVAPWAPGAPASATGGVAPVDVVTARRGGAAPRADQAPGSTAYDELRAALDAEGRTLLTRGGGPSRKAGMVPVGEQRQGAVPLADDVLTEHYRTERASADAALGLREAQDAAGLSAMREQDRLGAHYDAQAEQRRLADNAYADKLLHEQHAEIAAANANIDPSRLWRESSTASKVVSGIALVFGALGGGLMKDGRNRAAEAINQAIDRDIEAQRSSAAAHGQKAGVLGQVYQQALARTGSHQAAVAAQKIAALDAVKRKADEMALSAGSDVYQARKNAFTADIDKMIDGENKTYLEGVLGARTQTLHYQPASSGGGASPAALKAYKANRKEAFEAEQSKNKSDAEAGKARREGAPETVVFGRGKVTLNPELKPPEAEKLREGFALANAAQESIKRLRAQQNTYGAGTIDRKTARTIVHGVAAATNHIVGEGGMTKDNEDDYADNLTGLGSANALNELERHLKTIIREKLRQTGSGFDVDVPSDAPPGR